MRTFLPLEPKSLTDNVFSLIGQDWMLITAGGPDHFNMMTASWGGLGVLWHKNVCFVFVRPSRYTYEFMEKNETFSLNFFSQEYRSVLNLCGQKSGRDIDKTKETGLTPFALEHGATGFEQSRLIIECKKLYYQDLNPDHFLDPNIIKNYLNGDFHRMYVGEILSIKENSGK